MMEIDAADKWIQRWRECYSNKITWCVILRSVTPICNSEDCSWIFMTHYYQPTLSFLCISRYYLIFRSRYYILYNTRTTSELFVGDKQVFIPCHGIQEITTATLISCSAQVIRREPVILVLFKRFSSVWWEKHNNTN